MGHRQCYSRLALGVVVAGALIVLIMLVLNNNNNNVGRSKGTPSDSSPVGGGGGGGVAQEKQETEGLYYNRTTHECVISGVGPSKDGDVICEGGFYVDRLKQPQGAVGAFNWPWESCDASSPGAAVVMAVRGYGHLAPVSTDLVPTGLSSASREGADGACYDFYEFVLCNFTAPYLSSFCTQAGLIDQDYVANRGRAGQDCGSMNLLREVLNGETFLDEVVYYCREFIGW